MAMVVMDSFCFAFGDFLLSQVSEVGKVGRLVGGGAFFVAVKSVWRGDGGRTRLRR